MLLKSYLEGNPEPLMLRNCAVINKEDKKSFVWKTKHYRTVADMDKKIIMDVSHPFNGTLLHRKIVEKVGLPKPAFLSGVMKPNTAFVLLVKIKYPIAPFPTVFITIQHQKTTYSTDWDFKTNWKMYYLLRNRLAILRSRFYQSIVLSTFMYLGFIFLFAGTVLVFQRTNKIKKLGFILWPVRDALNGNYKATPTIVLQKLSVTSRVQFWPLFSATN